MGCVHVCGSARGAAARLGLFVDIVDNSAQVNAFQIKHPPALRPPGNSSTIPAGLRAQARFCC